MTHFSLSTYLMASVLFIASGILWVLFVPIEKRYEYPTLSSGLGLEQNEIIERFYQSRSENSNPQQEVTALTLGNLPLKNEPKVITNAQPILNTYDNSWVSIPNTTQESTEFLHNNPWSPSYQTKN